jgi:hypothetical protein
VFCPADVGLALGVAALMGVAYFPIVKGLLSGPSDYLYHAGFAQRFLEEGVLYSPACLLHLVVAAAVALGLAPTANSGTMAVAVSGYAGAGAAIYLYARRRIEVRNERLGRILAVLAAAAIPFVQPAVPFWGTYTIGYIWTEPYFSPTYALLKPLAVAAAVSAVYFLTTPGKPGWTVIALSAAAVAAGTLAKPSFAICALPIVLLVAAYNWLRKIPFSKPGVAWGWLLPAVAVLAWQSLRTYASPGNLGHYTDNIIFAPLEVMRIHSTDLAIKYLRSVLFPLSVWAFYPRRAWADDGLRFASLAFLAGTAYTYTLGEKYNLPSGNFLWCSYITLFVLHVFAAMFLARQVVAAGRTPAALLYALPSAALFFWQLAVGISVHQMTITGILASLG